MKNTNHASPAPATKIAVITFLATIHQNNQIEKALSTIRQALHPFLDLMKLNIQYLYKIKIENTVNSAILLETIPLLNLHIHLPPEKPGSRTRPKYIPRTKNRETLSHQSYFFKLHCITCLPVPAQKNSSHGKIEQQLFNFFSDIYPFAIQISRTLNPYQTSDQYQTLAETHKTIIAQCEKIKGAINSFNKMDTRAFKNSLKKQLLTEFNTKSGQYKKLLKIIIESDDQLKDSAELAKGLRKKVSRSNSPGMLRNVVVDLTEQLSPNYAQLASVIFFPINPQVITPATDHNSNNNTGEANKRPH